MPRALKISEAAAIALHSAALIAAAQDKLLSARAIAARFQVSEAHVSKVLQRLVKAGLASSLRGPRGGFGLARPAEEITLLAVYEAIEGPIEPAACLFTTPLCEGDACILGPVMTDVNEILRKSLSGTRLSDLRHLFAGDAPELVRLGGGIPRS